jgi:radical SAM superfamily enzyme YgiQ (UPF0313 family)
MNILLISTNRNVLPMPVMPIGACMVAEAAERAGHTVHLLDLMFTKDARSGIASAVAGLRPDLVGLSVRNIDNNDMQDTVFFLHDLRSMVNAIRDRTSAPIIFGGAALAVMPEEILRLGNVSCGIIGDGDAVFPRVLERIEQNRNFNDIPGLAQIKQGVFRKNDFPSSRFSDHCLAPDYHKWLNVKAYQFHMATVPVQTKIGCQFQCVYCTYRKLEGHAYRLADPGSVADAVVRLSARGLRDIEFVDSVFNAPIDHAMGVCDALARVEHKTRLQSLELNPLSIDDSLLKAMECAGFVGMGITVESASDPVLRGLRKGFTSREIYRAAEVVRRHAIPCAWIFLLGGPGETQETVKETLRFAEKYIRPQDMAFFNTGIRIYPGTELESIARNQGVLSRSPKEMLSPVFYTSPEVDARWIEREMKKSMARHMHFINTDSIGLSFLPAIHRIGYKLGLRPPLWRHTRIIRRGLRLAGMDV